jgi:esterase
MKLFFRDKGDGFPIVFLHGLYGSSDNWLTISKWFSGHYRVIMPDLRNHGNSPHSESHCYKEMMDDLSELYQKLGIAKAHLVGHSMGGKLAMAFAADYPEYVKSLTVLDIAPRNYMLEPANSGHIENHDKVIEVISSLNINGFSTRTEIDVYLKKVLHDVFLRNVILKNVIRHEGGFQWKLNVEVLPKSMGQILSDIDFSFFEERLPINHYPVLFVKGGNSGFINDADNEKIMKIFSNVKMETIEGASHLLHVEQPEEFSKILLKFIVHSNF